MKSPFPHTRAFGQAIEDQAIEYYLRIQPRARLRERNYRKRCGELDLVFSVGEAEWIFIEVRARLGRDGGGPLQTGVESVSGKKSMRLKRVIADYLSKIQVADIKHAQAQLDILDWNGREFIHYPNVWI